jgi:hypothetical protein
MDTAIAGYQAVAISSTSQALTYVNGPSSSAALNQSVYAMLRFTGASAATSVYIPPVSKQYILYNSSGYTITIYNSTVIGNTTAAGSGVAIVNGDAITVWSDGTNVYGIKSSGVSGALPIANGGTGQTTAQAAINALTGAQTNNRVLRSDGTNATLSQVVLTTDVTGTLPVANGGTGVTSLAAIGGIFYPVGSIYTSTVATNPGTSLGFGTWTAFGAGRVMIGNGGGFSAGATGGSADAITVSHTHTATSTVTDPGHLHNLILRTAGAGPSTPSNWAIGDVQAGNQGSQNTQTNTTGITVATTNASTGSSGTNANLQPYIVVYMWERTA